MNKQSASGQCVCGAIAVELQTLPDKIEACHCHTCRRWGSGPFFNLVCKEGITWQGAENIKEFSSSDWASRAFCKNCGSHLYYHLKPTNQYMISPGLFADAQDKVLDLEVFIDEKPPYYSLSEDSRKLTGAEVIAMFNNTEDSQ